MPQQDVSTGTVQIVVTRFALGKVEARGNRWFSTAIIRDGITQKTGAPLDLVRLKHDLDWLNRNPFRRVDVQLEKGHEIGTTDVIVQTQDRLPLRVFAGLDNTGTRATGLTRWSLGFNYGNLFGLDQQISYQFTASDDLVHHLDAGSARFMAHAISWVAPLPWHDLIEIFGSYVRQKPDIGPFFGQTGHSGQASIRYIHPLDGPGWLSHELRAGFDFKTTDNNLDFGGIQIFAATQEVDQFSLTYAATEIDSAGVTTLQNDLIYSPGGLTGANTNAAFALSGTSYAKADYLYDTISLTRATRLPFGACWLMRAKAQWANGNLLPSEQLGAGGEDSVRGYDTRIANGSEGYLLSQELRSPPFSPTGLMLRQRPASATPCSCSPSGITPTSSIPTPSPRPRTASSSPPSAPASTTPSAASSMSPSIMAGSSTNSPAQANRQLKSKHRNHNQLLRTPKHPGSGVEPRPAVSRLQVVLRAIGDLASALRPTP